ncbi:DUF6184 family natural product biosynthesis lipoprotein [Pendulispora rubella]|uniref:DUF6184 family natural product biosynthesis lipoprotein n=1 Tax=Pendulispora rubella TaxID=2741070 RepID=A0ABZ2LC07_9BACT
MLYQLRCTLAASTMALAMVPLGCSSAPPRVGTTETTGAAWMEIDGAVHALAAARCDRQASCRRVPDRNTCVLEGHRATQSELQAGGCAGAIDHRAYEECHEALAREPCAESLESIPQVKACRAEKLCVRLQRGSLGG